MNPTLEYVELEAKEAGVVDVWRELKIRYHTFRYYWARSLQMQTSHQIRYERLVMFRNHAAYVALMEMGL
jgi:hypothetical protein